MSQRIKHSINRAHLLILILILLITYILLIYLSAIKCNDYIILRVTGIQSPVRTAKGSRNPTSLENHSQRLNRNKI